MYFYDTTARFISDRSGNTVKIVNIIVSCTYPIRIMLDLLVVFVHKAVLSPRCRTFTTPPFTSSESAPKPSPIRHNNCTEKQYRHVESERDIQDVKKSYDYNF